MNNIVLLTALLLCFGCKTSSSKLVYKNDVENQLNGFEGNWSWDKNNVNVEFTLKLKRDSNFLIGSYCGVFMQGQKIDCMEGDDYSFKLKYPTANEFTVFFKTSFSSNTGKVRISIENDKLLWQVIDKPKGEFYCPMNASLIRSDSN